MRCEADEELYAAMTLALSKLEHLNPAQLTVEPLIAWLRHVRAVGRSSLLHVARRRSVVLALKRAGGRLVVGRARQDADAAPAA